jgi:SAM-dependent methyltransferase
MLPRPLFVSRILSQQVAEHVRAGRGARAGALDAVRRWNESLARQRFRGYSETQLEGAFVQAIFVEVLGYELPGAGASHSLVPKRTGIRGRDIPDFVLGTFNTGTRLERWRAVAELKGIGVNLDLPQVSRYQRETPVQQAFRYALNGQPGTEWVLVSNLDEIRLYRNGYTAAFHSWRIAELCEPARLDEFYVVLGRQHLAPEGNVPSETLRILGLSQTVGLALTEGFYDLYDQARQRLVEALRAQATSGQDVSFLYGKAHKLLNRVLFSAFCEDHPAQLLPVATLEALHARAAQASTPNAFWFTFKKFFSDLDKGSPPGAPEAFNAFNGGLFAPDAFLDGLVLQNDLFTSPISSSARNKHAKEIQGVFGFHVYDFCNELDVDSLGAIFEQSLKDLPHQSASVRGQGRTAVTRREDFGVYYTPAALTEFLSSRGLEAVLDPIRTLAREEVEAQGAIGTRERRGRKALTLDESRDLRFLDRMLERVRGLSVIDPACGSGAFLVALFRQLYAEYDAINSGLAALKGAQALFGLDRIILRNNLYGIDVLPESAEIAKLSIWLRTASPKEPLEKLDATIWSQDTLRPIQRRDFDLVVSNPPWGAELTGWSDGEIQKRFPQCGQEKDSYAVFVIRAAELLRPGGVLAYVMPNSWLTVAGYEAFRRFVLETFDVLEIVNVWKIFDDVNHDCCLFVARKKGPGDLSSRPPKTRVAALARGLSERDKCQALAEERWGLSFEADAQGWLVEPAARFETMYRPDLAEALTLAQSKARNLGDLFDVTVGIQVYHKDRVPESLIKAKGFHSDTPKGKDWHPYITGNAVQRYYDVSATNQYVLYSERLCDKREIEHYAQPRILVQQIFWHRLRACLQTPESPYLYLNTLFSVTNPKSGLSLEAALAFLNSRFVSAAYERWTNRLFGDKFPKVSKLDLARLPVPNFSAADSRALHRLSLALSSSWVALKRRVGLFGDFATTRGVRHAIPEEFWALDRADLLKRLGGKKIGAEDIAAVCEAWEVAVHAIHSEWSKIATLEQDVDQLVCGAFGLKEDLVTDLILRAPEMSLQDVLLPK